VVGVASGTRVGALEEYIGATSYNKAALSAALTQDVWVLELYRTVVATLEGIVWLLLVVAFFVILAVLIIRKGNMKRPGVREELLSKSDLRIEFFIAALFFEARKHHRSCPSLLSNGLR
jgi:hypothetical protein